MVSIFFITKYSILEFIKIIAKMSRVRFRQKRVNRTEIGTF